jgi:hypothetical protein
MNRVSALVRQHFVRGVDLLAFRVEGAEEEAQREISIPSLPGTLGELEGLIRSIQLRSEVDHVEPDRCLGIEREDALIGGQRFLVSALSRELARHEELVVGRGSNRCRIGRLMLDPQIPERFAQRWRGFRPRQAGATD